MSKKIKDKLLEIQNLIKKSGIVYSYDSNSIDLNFTLESINVSVEGIKSELIEKYNLEPLFVKYKLSDNKIFEFINMYIENERYYIEEYFKEYSNINSRKFILENYQTTNFTYKNDITDDKEIPKFVINKKTALKAAQNSDDYISSYKAIKNI